MGQGIMSLSMILFGTIIHVVVSVLNVAANIKIKYYMDINHNFQTPPSVCDYMCSLIPKDACTILEPTPGEGNILKAINKIGKVFNIKAPNNFFDISTEESFDAIVMNPPFSSKYAFGIPETVKENGMRLGYYILTECMKMSDNVIALMPWFTISDSDVRLRHLKSYGLKSITALPRKTFQYARIQTCIFELEK